MPIWGTLSRGLLAGLLGSAAMHVFRLGWEAVMNRDPRKGIFGFDREADVNSIYFMCRCISLERPPEIRAGRTGLALHYVYGASLGALYALTKPRVRWIARSSGVAPGALLWIGADELPISLTGISDPFRRSLASHASALLSHVVFAVTVDQMVRGSADRRCIETRLIPNSGSRHRREQRLRCGRADLRRRSLLLLSAARIDTQAGAMGSIAADEDCGCIVGVVRPVSETLYFLD
jgi:hypothetical protein